MMLRGVPLAAQGASNPAGSTRVSWEIGIDGLGALPLGEFADHIDVSPGVSVYANWALRQSMFSVGGEVAWVGYGNASRTVYLGGLIPEVPNAAVDVATDNSMLLVHGRLRAKRQQGRWRPYADGQVGFTELYTDTLVKGAFECTSVPNGGSDCSQTESGHANHARDFVLSYGGSAGVMMRFGSWPASLDLAVRYHGAGEAVYLTEGAVRTVGDQVVLDFSRSRTDMLLFCVGVAFGR
jgi:hypothetical protein